MLKNINDCTLVRNPLSYVDSADVAEQFIGLCPIIRHYLRRSLYLGEACPSAHRKHVKLKSAGVKHRHRAWQDK